MFHDFFVTEKGGRYDFDYIIRPEERNDDVFNLLQPLLTESIEGFNICIIGYGASGKAEQNVVILTFSHHFHFLYLIAGSGKSHTMYGSGNNLGVVPRSVKYLLEEIKRCDASIVVKASCFEIYNETLVDLLHVGPKRNIVTIQTVGEVQKVVNLKEIDITTRENFDSVLDLASKGRKIGATQRNTDSSRSHVVFQINLSAKSGIASNIVFVDLAGMENSNDHLAPTTIINENNANQQEKIRKLEMSKINQSLSSLRVYVEGLSKKSNDLAYRSSKLTYFLKPYLTKNTKTALITTVSQDKKYFASSKMSFEFAQMVKQIRIGDVKKIFNNFLLK